MNVHLKWTKMYDINGQYCIFVMSQELNHEDTSSYSICN
jgi:hypothetical protein